MPRVNMNFKKITEMTPEHLQRAGIQALLIDVDNTLARHGAQEPYAGTLEWVAKMRAAGIAMIVLSNNTRQRVESFAAQYGLPFMALCCKPFPLACWLAAKKLGVPRRACAVVGDQMFTDVLAAYFAGMSVFLLEPIEEETHGFLHLKRKWEKPFRRKKQNP